MLLARTRLKIIRIIYKHPCWRSSVPAKRPCVRQEDCGISPASSRSRKSPPRKPQKTPLNLCAPGFCCRRTGQVTVSTNIALVFHIFRWKNTGIKAAPPAMHETPQHAVQGNVLRAEDCYVPRTHRAYLIQGVFFSRVRILSFAPQIMRRRRRSTSYTRFYRA